MANIEKTAVSRSKPVDFISGYRLEKLVGKGGMGEVYRAVQLSLGRTVAVKLLASDLAKEPSFVARFDKEGAALAALSHPNIVSIVDKGKTESTYYLVMEFIDGPSMREVMRSPMLDTGRALRMILDVCRAIDYAHSRGIIHRDLKPENILFDEQAGGIAKVSDFGLAGFVDEGVTSRYNLTEFHVAMGTASYMAPEQRIDAKTADHRADIYSLGVVLYELLVGELPMGQFDPPSQRKSGLDKRLDAICAKCLKPLAQDRYQKVSELIFDLEPLVPAAPSSFAMKAGPLARAKYHAMNALRRAARVAEVGLVLSAGVIVLVALSNRTEPAAPIAPGVELTTDFGAKWPLTATGRLDERPLHKRLGIGDGPDAISVVALGRKPDIAGSSVRFPPAKEGARGGRAVLDADIDGIAVALSADAHTPPRQIGRLTPLRDALFGKPPPGRSALLLVGDPGRYVALVVSEDGGPPLVEWALGSERRGSMYGGAGLPPGPLRLELAINADTGELSAFVGAMRDRRLIGDPIGLGSEWKSLFGRTPKGALGCLDGVCEFSGIDYVVLQPPPPPPPPVFEPLVISEPEPRREARAPLTRKAPAKTNPKAPASSAIKKPRRRQ